MTAYIPEKKRSIPEIQLSTEYNAVVSYEGIMPKIYFWHKTLTTTYQNSRTIIPEQSVDYTSGISTLKNILETPPENKISPYIDRKTGFFTKTLKTFAK